MMSEQRRVSARVWATWFSVGALAAGAYLSARNPSFIATNVGRDAQIAIAAGVLTASSTLGGLVLATYFLTAQLRPGGARGNAITELYRARELMAFLVAICGSIIASFGFFVVTDTVPVLEGPLLSAAGILSIFATMLVVPLALIQVENLSPTIVARKIVSRVRLSSVRQYGLARVENDSLNARNYTLLTHGLNYDRRDPLGPFHELMQQAIADKDRLLVGKLVGLLCERIAFYYGKPWPSASAPPESWSKGRGLWLALNSLTVSDGDRTAFSLHLIHYLRRLARNLLVSWPSYDVARHGVQFQLGKLISVLANAKNSESTIKIAVFAIMHVSLEFARILPYGRVEPLNALTIATSTLENSQRPSLSELSASVLGLIKVRTEQLSDSRAGHYLDGLSVSARTVVETAEKNAQDNESWLPGRPSDDPWRQSA